MRDMQLDSNNLCRKASRPIGKKRGLIFISHSFLACIGKIIIGGLVLKLKRNERNAAAIWVRDKIPLIHISQ